MVNVAVVGYGYWGPNLVRNFAETPGAKLVAVCDMNAARLEPIRLRYPAVEVTTQFDEVLGDPKVGAVALATPVHTHFDLAKRALSAGKHVLVEKPIASTSEEALKLIELAERQKRTLMVDHTFVYTPAVRRIRELIDGGQIGDVYYYDSTRINLGLFQPDVNVIWDLAVHDLSILEYILPAKPRAVSATGTAHVEGRPANVAYLTLFFDSALIAHVHVNWLAPVKLRQTLIGGSKKMIVYDDLQPSEKIKVYDKGITVTNDPESSYKLRVGYRSGDMWAPQLDATEALRTEALHFVRCVEKGERPQSDGAAGFRVVQVCEAATRSLAERGKLITLEDRGLA